jgi:hypothetical protein
MVFKSFIQCLLVFFLSRYEIWKVLVYLAKKNVFLLLIFTSIKNMFGPKCLSRGVAVRRALDFFCIEASSAVSRAKNLKLDQLGAPHTKIQVP